MDMSDMVDVLHYFFEEDSTKITSAEQGEARDAVRTQLYSMFYNREYLYAGAASKRPVEQFYDDPLDDDSIPAPFDPVAGPTKKYTPPTSFDPDSSAPFGGVLDAPLK
jgi:hypothetical protein